MAAIALLAAAAGYFLASKLAPVDSSPPPALAVEWPASPESLLGEPRPGFTLISTDGENIDASSFDGQVLLINFWATWCAPCVEEMPMLSGVANQYAEEGLAVLGIAIDDPGKARDFARELALAYPVAVGTTETAMAGRAYGNRSGMLPFSVLVDRAGIVRWAHLGALEREELERRIRPLL
jgi:peroxiredoxin